MQNYQDLELSTQIVIEAALKRKVQVEVLDRLHQFLRLSRDAHVQYVKDGTRTACDSYMSFLLMENKSVCKQVLREHGLQVPNGEQYFGRAEAMAGYDLFNNMDIVIKPTTTNFGLGIYFLRQGFSLEEYAYAVENSFKHDDSVIVEQWVTGNEHRFLVVDGKVVAVCERMPANVVGDGEHSIAELVEIKNQDPRRGEHYKKALEKIQFGEEEQALLSSQGLDMSSIPSSGTRIFLRRNSNISTGGDSYDRTDEVDEHFKSLAIQAADAVQAKICGVDMMLSEDHYSILELNFNPVLYIHNTPYEGKNRDVGAAILDLLGFK